jgi:hypothetical protein
MARFNQIWKRLRRAKRAGEPFVPGSDDRIELFSRLIVRDEPSLPQTLPRSTLPTPVHGQPTAEYKEILNLSGMSEWMSDFSLEAIIQTLELQNAGVLAELPAPRGDGEQLDVRRAVVYYRQLASRPTMVRLYLTQYIGMNLLTFAQPGHHRAQPKEFKSMFQAWRAKLMSKIRTLP